jgi:hypothetical protein
MTKDKAKKLAQKRGKGVRTSGNAIRLPGDFGKNLVVKVEKMDVNIKIEQPRRVKKVIKHSVAYDALVDAGYKSWAVFRTKTLENDPLYTSIKDDKQKKYKIETLLGVDDKGNYFEGIDRQRLTLVLIFVEGTQV